jgi:Zn-dependent peptidase ImmA (M78 family)/transcriptional regulator with XRE-family HTH domain
MKARDIFGKRLKQARQKAGLSMDELANKIGREVSKQTISKYEAGKTMAGSAVLIKLSQALGVTVDYFFKTFSFDVSEIDVSFRKKASIGVKEQTILKIKIQNDVERFIDIEKILEIEPKILQINVPTQISSSSQMIMLAKEVRKNWGLGISPISCVKDVLMSHGVKVFDIKGPDGFDGISGYVNEFTPLVVVNSNMPNTERRRFTHMHELAHLLANVHFDKTLSKHDKERLCNDFASEMLLPAQVIENEFGHKSRISIQELKKIQITYGISIDAIVYSFKRLGIISDKRYRIFCIRKNTSPEFKTMVEETRYIEPSAKMNYDDESYQVLVYSALAQNLISLSKASQLLRCSTQEVESQLYAI